MIKAILFDYDGVLTPDKTGLLSTCKYLSETTGIDLDRLLLAFKPFNKDLVLGKTTHDKIWDDFCTELGTKLDIKILHDAFLSTPTNPLIFELVKKLKGLYKTGLITDNKKDRLVALIEYQKLNDYFDTIIVSADIGSGKENEEIFSKTVELLGVKYDECVFVDNQEKNLVVPKRLGIGTIFYDYEKNDVDELILNLKNLGVKI